MEKACLATSSADSTVDPINGCDARADVTTDLATVSVLLQRAHAGCQTSRDQLLGQIRDYLTVLATRHRDQKLAAKLGVSDIVQQSLVKAFEGFDAFQGETEGQWKAWLKMLLINEVRQSSRHFGRQKRQANRERAIDRSDDGPRVELRGSQSSPLSVVIRHEQLARMRLALQTLSDDYQTVIRLRAMEQMELAEIAQEMNRSVEATGKLWYRAILKLQSVLAQPDDTHLPHA